MSILDFIISKMRKHLLITIKNIYRFLGAHYITIGPTPSNKVNSWKHNMATLGLGDLTAHNFILMYSQQTRSMQFNNLIRDIVWKFTNKVNSKLNNVYLGVTIGHILHDAARRKPPAVQKCVCIGAVLIDINGNINHSPHTLCMLLGEAEELQWTDWNQRRKHLKLGVHLQNKIFLSSDLTTKDGEGDIRKETHHLKSTISGSAYAIGNHANSGGSSNQRREHICPSILLKQRQMIQLIQTTRIKHYSILNASS